MRWFGVACCGFTFIFFCLLSPQSLKAQRNGATNSVESLPHGLVVNSAPQGAYVELTGAYTFIGRTPFTVPHELHGKYRVKATKDGYESVSSSVNIARSGASKISIRLSRKNRGKSAIRSLILPGWGQFYGQNKFKGWFMTLSQATLSGAAVYSAIKFDDKRDEYERALMDFNRVRFDLDQAQASLEDIQRKLGDARDARDLRNAFIYVSAGFWVYNFLDSIIFFSKNKTRVNKLIRQTPLFSGGLDEDGFMISMNIGL